jgi:hypothetical protein
LDRNDRHFEGDLGFGECSFGFDNDRAARIFGRHRLTTVDEQSCPEIIAFARLWTFGHGGGLIIRNRVETKAVTARDCGEYEIDVSGNRSVEKLLKDQEFQALNGGVASCEAS